MTNWLFYLGGWVIIGFTLERILFGEIGDVEKAMQRLGSLIGFTMVWIWICWKFIR